MTSSIVILNENSVELLKSSLNSYLAFFVAGMSFQTRYDGSLTELDHLENLLMEISSVESLSANGFFSTPFQRDIAHNEIIFGELGSPQASSRYEFQAPPPYMDHVISSLNEEQQKPLGINCVVHFIAIHSMIKKSCFFSELDFFYLAQFHAIDPSIELGDVFYTLEKFVKSNRKMKIATLLSNKLVSAAKAVQSSALRVRFPDMLRYYELHKPLERQFMNLRQQQQIARLMPSNSLEEELKCPIKVESESAGISQLQEEEKIESDPVQERKEEKEEEAVVVIAIVPEIQSRSQVSSQRSPSVQFQKSPVTDKRPFEVISGSTYPVLQSQSKLDKKASPSKSVSVTSFHQSLTSHMRRNLVLQKQPTISLFPEPPSNLVPRPNPFLEPHTELGSGTEILTSKQVFHKQTGLETDQKQDFSSLLTSGKYNEADDLSYDHTTKRLKLNSLIDFKVDDNDLSYVSDTEAKTCQALLGQETFGEYLQAQKRRGQKLLAAVKNISKLNPFQVDPTQEEQRQRQIQKHTLLTINYLDDLAKGVQSYTKSDYIDIEEDISYSSEVNETIQAGKVRT